jgi:hypothetical protein
MMAIVVVIDVLLDGVFLFLFDFGMYGVAAASVISMLAGGVFGFVELERGVSNYHFQIRKLGFEGMKDILRFGSPAAVSNFSDSIKLFTLNAIILYVGGEAAMAVWAVLNSVSEFFLCIVLGVPRAAFPMIGVFYAARENSGIRILMKIQVKVGICLVSILSVFLLVFHKGLENLFAIQDNLMIPLLCLEFSVLMELVSSIFCSYFNAMGRIMLSDGMMVLKSFIFPVGAILVINMLGGYRWLFLTLGSALTLLTLVILIKILAVVSKKTNHPRSGVLLLDDFLEREGKVLDFSITPSSENNCEASERIKDFCEGNHMNAKQTNRIQLSIEELLEVIAEKIPNLQSVDLRVFAFEDSTGVRIRCDGKPFNPFMEAERGEGDFYMGINMLKGMAKEVKYSYTLGMNTLNIMF